MSIKSIYINDENFKKLVETEVFNYIFTTDIDYLPPTLEIEAGNEQFFQDIYNVIFGDLKSKKKIGTIEIQFTSHLFIECPEAFFLCTLHGPKGGLLNRRYLVLTSLQHEYLKLKDI